MNKVKYVVSACLSGEKCRYDGKANYRSRISTLVQEGFAALICPEVMGGLNTPRCPCEIIGDKVINKDGEDKTSEFKYGAERALELAQSLGIKKAILKSKSPSCGNIEVYDGTFTGKLVEGQGVTAKLLADNDIEVFNEDAPIVYDAIVVAAGSGVRTGLSYNKVFHFSGKTTVIEKAVEPFVTDFLCGKVVIVCKSEEQPMFEALLPYSKIVYASGGSSREESVYNGLQLCSANHVLIHDGARANISHKLVDHIVREIIKGNDCVIPYLLHENGDTNDFVVNKKAIQTPQGIKRTLLLKGMNLKRNTLHLYRDESSILEEMNEKVYYIEGEESNFKITDIEDLEQWCIIHRNEE